MKSLFNSKERSEMANHTTAVGNGKPYYAVPTIVSYQAQTLLQQLGPARAYSSTRSIDEELLFPDHHP